MARLTKLRARQTRAGDSYTADNSNLATDGEVEARVRKHSAIFHGTRNDDTTFSFDGEGNLSNITVCASGTSDILKSVDFIFDENGNLSSMINEVFDLELNSYIKKQKDLSYNTNGNIENISNTIL